jgi:hypothetical protein
MKKKELPRLTLNRETIKRLDAPDLVEQVIGGENPPSSQVCCPQTFAPHC